MITIECPAKINLFLSVGPIDRRGYHPIRTIFQTIDLYDRLHIEKADKDVFDCNVSWVPSDNTVTRTLKLLRDIYPIPPLKVFLEKHLPAQAGLGAGSSNAAGMIKAAREILQIRDSFEEELSVAAAVGADVPFFLLGGRAKGEGYGERLTPLPALPPRTLLIAKPEIGCSTPEMYRKLDEFERPWAEFPVEDRLHNDFEQVAPQECLDLIQLLISLGADDAGLSGSGSAVFGRFSDRDVAARADSFLRTKTLHYSAIAAYL